MSAMKSHFSLRKNLAHRIAVIEPVRAITVKNSENAQTCSLVWIFFNHRYIQTFWIFGWSLLERGSKNNSLCKINLISGNCKLPRNICRWNMSAITSIDKEMTHTGVWRGFKRNYWNSSAIPVDTLQGLELMPFKVQAQIVNCCSICLLQDIP